MESNWRFNVWRLGLVGLTGSVYARLRHPTMNNLYVTTGYPRSSDTALIMQLVVGEGLFDQQLQMGFFFGTKPDGAGSPFPYGFDVDPDQPND